MSTTPHRIPVAAPDLTGNEEKYVLEALRSSWISSTGPFIDRFEREFAAVNGTRTSIGVCNGTVALHLALLALDVRPGDEVLVPSLTYIATANAVRYVGAEPVFVDVDPSTWCIDPATLATALTDLQSNYPTHKSRATSQIQSLCRRTWSDVADDYWTTFTAACPL